MKLLLHVLLLSIPTLHVAAQIGESPKQCTAKFGSPTSVNQATKELTFRQGNYIIVCAFNDDKCMSIKYSHPPALGWTSGKSGIGGHAKQQSMSGQHTKPGEKNEEIPKISEMEAQTILQPFGSFLKGGNSTWHSKENSLYAIVLDTKVVIYGRPHGSRIKGSVIQVVDDGIIVETPSSSNRVSTDRMQSVGGGGGFYNPPSDPKDKNRPPIIEGTYFIEGLPKQATIVDGEKVDVDVEESGVYEKSNVTGKSRIKKFKVLKSY